MQSFVQILDEVLPHVSKPARYTGNELNAVRKNWDDVEARVALAFPDIYDVGMGHLGLKILYSIINSRSDALAERVFAPWVDFEEHMRQRNIPLYSLESYRPLGDFDIIGFTLQYELSYTNVLNMLELSGVPLKSEDRREGMPFVIGGGPCAFNPEPLWSFFDLFVIGEGEEVIGELLDLFRDWKRSGEPRRHFLERACAISGIYVPSMYRAEYEPDGRFRRLVRLDPAAPERITKRVVDDLDKAPYPEEFVVPFVDVVHDRAMVEVLRGCTRGCRFCQAGMIYRPVRERRKETLEKQVAGLLESTGYEEISLTSLSSSDYTRIRDLVNDLIDKYGECGVAVSLPSLRVDSFSIDLANQIQKVRKTGITLAPEAGTQRMRDVINKNVTEEDLLKAVEGAFLSGWESVKLYFMIGLPTETDDDVLGISDLAKKVVETGRMIRKQRGGKGRSPGATISVASFVPKPHTPFQWEAQNRVEELERKQKLLLDSIKGWKDIKLDWHDARSSLLEAVFARGDRRLAGVLFEARKAGLRFDGWSDHFRFDEWMKVFQLSGIDPEFYACRERDLDEALPWDHIDSGVTKKFLAVERRRSRRRKTTPDCRFDQCTGCAVCPGLGVDNRLTGVGIG